MATATVTISRASPADAKSIVPLTAAHDGNFRSLNPQDNTLQNYQANTGVGQSGQAHRLSEDNAGYSSVSSEGKVAITPLGQQPLPSQPAALAPTPSMGPLSSHVVVPARPKPGRKPLPQEDAQDRRRVQNRMAQRNFRDKRAQKVSELTADLERVRGMHQKDNEMNANRLQDHKKRISTLSAENESLKQQLQDAIRRAEDAERKAHSLDVTKRFSDAGFPNAGLKNVGTGTVALPPIRTAWDGPVADRIRDSTNATIPTPPDDGANNHNHHDWTETETDMSGLWNNIRGTNNTSNNASVNNVQHNNINTTSDVDNQWLSPDMEVDDNCGFCTDESNCACIQSQKPQSQHQPQPQPQHQPQPQAQPVIAPGGCDACIRDPARAAACKALADRSEVSQRPAQPSLSNGGPSQRNDSKAVPSAGMMSCSKFIDRLGPRMPSISELFPRGTLHSYPRDIPGGFGYDVSEHEAAQVLQSMHAS